MKKHGSCVKRLTIFFILIIQMLTQTACVGNNKQIQKLFLVVAMGVDLNSDGRYEVTMQALNPATSSNQTNSGSTGSTNEVLLYSGIGDGFYDAVLEASKTMGKVQHFGHLNYIVVGEALAQSEQEFLADSFFRQEEIRLNTPMLATKGRASEIVLARSSESPIPADVVRDLLDRQQIIGYRPYTYLLDVINSLGSKTIAPIIGVIELVKPEDKVGSETFKLSGTAVFKEGKLVGYLNDKETRGLSWVNGNVEVGNITATCPNLGKVSLEILRSSSKIKPVINESSVSLQIKIKTSSVIRAIYTPTDPVKKPSIMDEIGRAQSKVIEEEVKLAIRNARDNLGADVFGFSEKVHASYPKEWSSMEKNWDSIYQNMNIDVVVDSRVRTTGSILKSIE
jgi:spore germination protein KC